MSSTVRAARCFMSWTKAVWDGGWRGHPCPGALSDSRETRRSRKGIPARKGDFGVYQHFLDSFGGVPRRCMLTEPHVVTLASCRLVK